MVTLIHKMILLNNNFGVENYNKLVFNVDSTRDSFEVVDMTRSEHFSEGENRPVAFSPLVSQSVDTEGNRVVITVPMLKPGDMFEYKIRIYSNSPVITGHFWTMQNMADVYPTEKSVFSIEMPENIELFYQCFAHETEPRISSSGGNINYTWELENLDPVRSLNNEKSDESMPRVIVSSVNSWDVLAEWLSARYFEKIADNDRTRRLALSLTQMTGNEIKEHMAMTLARFVSLNIVNYDNGVELDTIVPNDAEAVLKNRRGDCKDKAVLLLSLLYSVGIEAYPALLNNDRDSNIAEMLPVPYYFNHAIVYVPPQATIEHKLWLDPTDVNLISTRSMNISHHKRKQALILRPNGESRFEWMEGTSTE
ncbi:MAG TPA: DUF3857 domain-containing protein [bacterium]|nr:DUF3857 domain-containing protein [bacterium]